MESDDKASALATPVIVKAADDLEWPREERMFYVVARDGLMIGRNHPFFSSCVPAREGPSELAEQRAFLRPRFPRIPRPLFERVVGFFDRIAELHNAEASALLAWDPQAAQVRLLVPRQTATVYRTWSGHQSPVGLHYTPPTFPSGWIPFGDVHSHVNMAAYSSQTDRDDEAYSAGLHIVVGRIGEEPPEIHVEAVVDGVRFHLTSEHVIEGYRRRDRDVPEAWIESVDVECEAYAPYSSKGGAYS